MIALKIIAALALGGALGRLARIALTPRGDQ